MNVSRHKRINFAVLAGLIAIVITEAASAQAYPPNEADMEIIKVELSKQMLDPSSTIVSNVVATDQMSKDGEVMTWVCGSVRGKNTYGGYAQPTPFMGALLNPPKGERTFLTIKIAEPNSSSRYAVLSTCLEKIEEFTLEP